MKRYIIRKDLITLIYNGGRLVNGSCAITELASRPTEKKGHIMRVWYPSNIEGKVSSHGPGKKK